MADINDLIIRLDATTEQLRIKLRQSEGFVSSFEQNANQSLTKFESAIDRASKRVMESFNDAFKQAGAVATLYLGAEGIKKVIEYSDSWRVLESRLKIVSDTAQEVSVSQEKLFDISQRTRTSVESNVSIYASLGNVLTDVEKKQFNLLNITETLSKGFALTGGSAEDSKNFVIQFGQAVDKNFKASSQELNTLITTAPALAKAISIELGGKAASDLKKFGEAGELSSEKVLNAVEKVSAGIAEQFDKMDLTVGQSLTKLDNAFLRYIGRNDAIMGGTSSLALGISNLADHFDEIAKTVDTVALVLGAKLASSLALSAAAFAQNGLASSIASIKQMEAAKAMEVAASSAAGNTRMLAAMRTAQLAAAGSSAELAIVVGSTGKAAIVEANGLTLLSTAAKAGSVAMRGLSLASALVGGPLGLVVLTIGYLATRTQELSAAQKTSNEFMARNAEITDALAVASGTRAEQLKKERQELIDKTKAEIEDTKAMIIKAQVAAKAALANQSNFVSDKVGASPEAVMAGQGVHYGEDQLKDLNKLLHDLEESAKKTQKAVSSVGSTDDPTEGLNAWLKLQDEAERKQKALNNAIREMIAEASSKELTQGTDKLVQDIGEAELKVQKLKERFGEFNALQLAGVNKYLSLVREKASDDYFDREAKKDKAAQDKKDKAALAAAKKQAEELRKPYEHALESIQNTFSNTFENIFDGSINSAADAADAIKKIFIKLAAETATLELLNVTGLNKAFTSTSLGTAAGVARASGSGTGSVVGGVLREGTSLLGATGIGSAINAFGASALPSIFATGAPVAGVVGPQAAGLLGSAGIGLSSIALPVAGLAVAALLSGAFGGKTPHPASNFAASIGTDGAAGLQLFSKHTDTSQASALGKSVDEISKALVAAGINVAGKVVQGGVDNNRGFLTIGTQDFKSTINDPAKTVRFDPNGGEAATNEAMAELAKRLALSADNANKYANALNHISSKGRTAEAVLGDISFILQFDKIGDTPKQLSETQAAVAALIAKFDDTRATAERLGLSIDKVNEAQKKQLSGMLAASAADIANGLLDALTPDAKKMQDENLRYAGQLRDLQALGATAQQYSMAELLHNVTIHKLMEGNNQLQQDALDTEKTRLDTAKQLADRFGKIQTSMQGLISDLTTGKYSNLDPVSNLTEVRSQVQSLGARAKLGDADAAEQLSTLIPSFVELSGKVNGFNSVYEQDRAMAESLARDTLSVADRQVTLQQQIVSEAQMQTAVLTAGFSGLQDAITKFGSNLTVGQVVQTAAGGDRFGAHPALNQALATATGFTGRFSPNPALDEFAKFRASHPELEAIIQQISKSQGFATGGLVGGESGVDSNLARLTRGEFVMNTNAVRAIGAPALAVMNATGKATTSDMTGVVEGLQRVESGIKALIRVTAAGGDMTTAQLSALNGEFSDLKRNTMRAAAGA